MQSIYRLAVRSGPSVGKVYPLDKNEEFVGRDLNNDIVINDPEISRRHARLYVQGNGYVLEDLGSTNGTFVNGQRLLGPHVLRPGDTITFGERLNLVFESSDVDQDATQVSPAGGGAYAAQPGPVGQGQAPISPEPVYAPPPPQGGQAYTGQVPAAYDPNAPAAPAKSGSRVWLIVLIILILLCICVGLVLFFAPKTLWCLLPIWPTGACP